ncbi:MAG: response regulator [Fimbriimonadales bacterium]
MPARILLIEDNPENLELMSYLLGAFAYVPRTAMDGAAGLEAARAEAFDLIICDVHLPVIDGYEVARRLKADPTLRPVPLIAVTALAMVGDREKVLAAGFDNYIPKPIDPEAFVGQVQAFLRPTQRSAGPKAFGESATVPAPLASGRTILVVDNMRIQLELARSILEPHGYRVLTAEGVGPGLALARAHPCDLILSDVCLTGESGFDFIRAVKADPRLRGIPFIFVTSTMMTERDRVAGLAVGAERYLTRPIEPEALLAEIEDCLRAEGKFAHGDHPDRR